MAIRVLIVDDSSFIIKRIQEILQEEREFKVVGTAANGLEAVQKTTELQPDVITMDVEMPVMDGITAVRKIMQETPTPILMFSSSTHFGAKATLKALEAGAIDFLPKQLEEISGDREMAKRLLRRRVRTVALQSAKIKAVKVDHQQPALSTDGSHKYSPVVKKYSVDDTLVSIRKISLLVIVASTGGPVAIQKILPRLPKNCPFPVLLIQHMPQTFTKSFAGRLNQLASISVKEAEQGDCLRPGMAFLAPGGMQLAIEVCAKGKCVAIRNKTAEEIYGPCADITLTSVAEHYRNRVLTVILTGMGADGKIGAAKLKQQGAAIWAQNEASCTVYGMPKAVIEANLSDHVFSLDELAAEFGKIN